MTVVVPELSLVVLIGAILFSKRNTEAMGDAPSAPAAQAA